MARDGGPNILAVVGVAGAAYLAYEYWQYGGFGGTPNCGTIFGTPPGANCGAASPAISTTTPSSPVSAAPSSPPVVSAQAVAPAAPAYTGPSLDAMYAALVAAVVTGMQNGDAAVTCPGQGVSGFGLVRTRPVPAPVVAVRGAARSAAPASCTAPMASPDVWNWYLVNRANVGVTSAPSSAAMGLAESTPVSGPTYWAAAAPLLQQQIPGLAGWRGLGAFASAFRRGLGDTNMGTDLSSGAFVGCPGSPGCFGSSATGPSVQDLMNLPTTNPALSLQTTAEMIPGATVNPSTGAVTVPLSLQTSSVSMGMWVLAGGAVLLLFAVGAAAR